MRKFILKWLGAVGQEKYNEFTNSLVSEEESKLKAFQEISKIIRQDHSEISKAFISLYKLELVMKHGCFDCFAISGEWHRENCPVGVDLDGNKLLVRRNNGRQQTGKC